MKADLISASGNIYVDPSAKLRINLFGIVRSTETKIPVFNAGGLLTGNFGGDPIEISGYKRELGSENYVLQTSTDNKNLYLLRVGSSNLSTHEGLAGLTHNQYEVARSLDEISAGFTRGAVLTLEMENLIFNKVVGLNDDDMRRKALDELSGSLIANALVMGATGRADEEIFGKVKWDSAFKSAWLQTGFFGANYAKDGNSGKTDFGGYGFTGGGNIACGQNWVAGAYGGVNVASMKQDGGKADLSEFGAGVYGGYFGDRVDFKARIYGGILNYNIDRRMETLGLTANSHLDAYNIKFDLRAERVGEFNVLYGYSLFAQLKSGYEIHSGAKETGAYGANLEIYAGDYFKTEALSGAELNFGNGRLLWRVKVFGGYLIAGDKPVFKGEFLESGRKMEIWGIQRGSLGIGASLGAEYKITERINAYFNVAFDAAEKYSGYYGQVGTGYRFGGGNKDYKSTPAAGVVADSASASEKDAAKPVKTGVLKKSAEDLNSSGADEEWNMDTKGEKVSINIEQSGRLRTNEKSSLWLVNYSDKVYVYQSSQKAEKFFNKLKSVSSEDSQEELSLREVKGVELSDKPDKP
jgi:hypothetical protein